MRILIYLSYSSSSCPIFAAYDQAVTGNKKGRENNMEHFEMAVKLSEQTGVDFEEARDALERNNWDMADAMRELDSVRRASGSAERMEDNMNTQQEQTKTQNGNVTMEKIGNFLSNLVAKGNRNRLEVHRHGRLLFKIPLTVLALIALFWFWLIFPGMLVTWFFGWRYTFEGVDIPSSKEYQHHTQSGTVS